MGRCRIRCAATLLTLTLAIGWTRSASDTPDRPAPEKENRPSQAAVLAENSVVSKDVAYGKDEKQRLDVYRPRGAKNAPVVVFVHGGEWAKGDKADVGYKPKFLNENGIVFVSTNYRLSPAVTHPAHVKDVAAAVRWVHDHAAEVGASPNKIVLMGHSAGCHLVTLVSLDPRYLKEVALRPTDLRGVVAWSGGAYDLVKMVNAGGSYAPHIKRAFGEQEEGWRDASPVAHVSDAKEKPSYLFISVERGNPSHEAAERLAGLIRDTKARAECRLLEGRTHLTANYLLGAPGDTTAKILLEFIRDLNP